MGETCRGLVKSGFCAFWGGELVGNGVFLFSPWEDWEFIWGGGVCIYILCVECFVLKNI